MNIRNRAVAVGLTAALTFGVYAPFAYATPQSELAEASQKLEAYGDELTKFQEDLEAKTEELENTAYRIGQKESDITKTKEDLKQAKQVLWHRMRSSYKSGSGSLLSVLVGADNIDDIISRIYYMDKVATSDAEAIAHVRHLEEQLIAEKDDLEKTKNQQQEEVDELQEQVDTYETKVAEARAYYDALDAQIQAEIAAQQAAAENARIQAVMQAAQDAQAIEEYQAQQTDNEQTNDATGGQSNTQNNTADNNGESNSNNSDSGSSGGTSYGPSGGGLSTAYAAIGSPYVYGATGPSSFDCSGLVCYSYGYARGRTTYDMIDSLKSTGSWKTSMDQLEVGDLVFTSEGHVGIYTGGGTMVHAPAPGRTVCSTTVWSFIGGGTY